MSDAILNFDPVDLALLGCGWAQGAGRRASAALSIERAQELADTAEMLNRLWLEVDADNWAGVFGYDVAEPLGVAIGKHFAENDCMPGAPEIESWARELIAAQYA